MALSLYLQKSEKGAKLKNKQTLFMRLFFTKNELKLRKKRIVIMVACMAAVLGIYLVLTWPKR